MRPGDEPRRARRCLKGVVVAADTGAPMRRAQVRAVGARQPGQPGDHHRRAGPLRAARAGRAAATRSRRRRAGSSRLQYGQRRPGERGTPVDLPAGSTIEKITIGLPRGSVIAGRIVDEFGEPLTGAQVQVLRYAYVNGARQLRPAGPGRPHRRPGVVPRLRAAARRVRRHRRRCARIAARGGCPVPTTSRRRGYAPTYFPGTTSAADAQRVTRRARRRRSTAWASGCR